MTEPQIVNVNERWIPVGGMHGTQRAPVTAVLVAGTIGDYAVYIGTGTKAHAVDIARFGDKLRFAEARCHFPYLDEDKYRE